jgi:hypothetical protein
VRLAFGTLFIEQRLGLTIAEPVEQIRENAFIQFSLAFPDIPARHSSTYR